MSLLEFHVGLATPSQSRALAMYTVSMASLPSLQDYIYRLVGCAEWCTA